MEVACSLGQIYENIVCVLIRVSPCDSPRAEMEGKLAAAQEREKELETSVEELQGYKEQLEEELLTLRDETSKQVSILFPQRYHWATCTV